MWIMWTTSEETSRKTLCHLLRKYWKYHKEWDTRESLILFNTTPPFQTLSLSMSASALLFYLQFFLFTVFFYSKDWDNQFHSFNGMVLHQQSDIMVNKNWKHADKILRNFQLWKLRMRQILFSRPQRTRTFAPTKDAARARRWIYAIWNLVQVTARVVLEQTLVLFLQISAKHICVTAEAH